MKLVHINQLGVIICIFYLCSCTAPNENISKNYQLNKDAGVVLLSLTASGECGYAYFTEFREIYSSREYSLGMQDIGHERDWKKKKHDCPSATNDYFGKLVAIEIPAGTYQFFQFEGVSRNRRVFTEHEMNIKFTVKPGFINYIGNLHFHVMRKSLVYSVNNMSKRDIPLFLNKYNQFNSQNIIINTIHLKATKTIPV